jgi:hypothetical protein
MNCVQACQDNYLERIDARASGMRAGARGRSAGQRSGPHMPAACCCVANACKQFWPTFQACVETQYALPDRCKSKQHIDSPFVSGIPVHTARPCENWCWGRARRVGDGQDVLGTGKTCWGRARRVGDGQDAGLVELSLDKHPVTDSIMLQAISSDISKLCNGTLHSKQQLRHTNMLQPKRRVKAGAARNGIEVRGTF